MRGDSSIELNDKERELRVDKSVCMFELLSRGLLVM